MGYRRNKHLSRTALRFVATLPLFYISLNSSWTAHRVSFQSSFEIGYGAFREVRRLKD